MYGRRYQLFWQQLAYGHREHINHNKETVKDSIDGLGGGPSKARY